MPKKVSLLEAQDAKLRYYMSRRTEIRLGQYLMNTLIPDEPCAAIFYEENDEFAFEKFCHLFVEP